MTPTNWAPGLIVLAAGLAAAILFVLTARKPARPAAKSDEPLADLEAHYQRLISQLKELYANRHQLPAVEFETQKSQLEQAAAAALRARDEYTAHPTRGLPTASDQTTASGAASAPPPAGILNPQLRGALIGGGAIAFFIVVGMLLSQESGTRGEGGSMTGGSAERMGAGPPPPGAGPGPGGDPDLGAAMARLNQAPDDVGAMAGAAHLFLEREDFQHAATLTQRGLGIDPFHLETRVHRALLDAMQGRQAAAQAELVHLAEAFPDAYEALLYAGAMALQQGDKAGALSYFERVLAEAPSDARPSKLGEQVQLLRAELASK